MWPVLLDILSSMCVYGLSRGGISAWRNPQWRGGLPDAYAVRTALPPTSWQPPGETFSGSSWHKRILVWRDIDSAGV